jgi:hypothetical protein
MAFEKRYTAKEAALAVLKKTEELLRFSRLAKAENPDEKQDAKLGEEVEHLCEDHMIENKAAEKKEGHKLVQKSECMKCNLVKPTPASGQGDTLRLDAKDREWQMDKSEFADLTGDFAELEEMFKAEREGGVDVGSKKLGYKPSKLGAEEKQAEPSDKAFQVEGKEHKSSDDSRMGHTNDPDKDPKEGAEGNNAEPGSKPGVESHPGQDAHPISETKGHLKLAKFIGRMEHKRSLRNPGMDKAEGLEKADTLSAKRGEVSPGGHVRSAQRAFTHAKNPNASSPKIEREMGRESMAAAKKGHAKKLEGIKSQPKPKLPR